MLGRKYHANFSREAATAHSLQRKLGEQIVSKTVTANAVTAWADFAAAAFAVDDGSIPLSVGSRRRLGAATAFAVNVLITPPPTLSPDGRAARTLPGNLANLSRPHLQRFLTPLHTMRCRYAPNAVAASQNWRRHWRT